MLMVTTTMGMLDGVHGDTSHSGPVVPLGLHLVPHVTGLQDWLVGSSTTGNEANHGSALRGDGLPGSGWESDSGLSSVLGVSDDDAGGSGGSCEGASISGL